MDDAICDHISDKCDGVGDGHDKVLPQRREDKREGIEGHIGKVDDAICDHFSDKCDGVGDGHDKVLPQRRGDKREGIKGHIGKVDDAICDHISDKCDGVGDGHDKVLPDCMCTVLYGVNNATANFKCQRGDGMDGNIYPIEYV